MFDRVLEKIFVSFLVISLMGLIFIGFYHKKMIKQNIGCEVIFVDDTELYLICGHKDVDKSVNIGDTLIIER